MSVWLVAWGLSGEVEMVLGGCADRGQPEAEQAQIFRESGCRSVVVEAEDIMDALHKAGALTGETG